MHKDGKWILKLKTADGKNDSYEMRIILIRSHHPDGTPNECELVQHNQKIDLKKLQEELGRAPEFMTAFVPCVMIGNEGNG